MKTALETFQVKAITRIGHDTADLIVSRSVYPSKVQSDTDQHKENERRLKGPSRMGNSQHIPLILTQAPYPPDNL